MVTLKRDGYDSLRWHEIANTPEQRTYKMASILHDFLSDASVFVPFVLIERGMRKVMQELYVPGGDVETSKRLAERNAGLALEVERLKSQLQQQEEDMLRYDRFLDAVEDAIKTCQAEPSS